MNEDILKINLERRFPIPGSSLTADPDNPAPFDRPPKFTNLHRAIDYIFQQAIERENYSKFMELMAQRFPLMEVVQTVLFAGFTQGLWTHQLMLMLIEPTTYIFLALCERAGVDPKFFRDDTEDELEEEEALGVSFPKEKIKSMQADIENSATPHPAITEQMQAQIDALPAADKESLLAKAEGTETPEQMEEEEAQELAQGGQ